ncbi:MAG: L-threonylcarbamoyladenylate synthase [Candidatus Korobacteraceae bacterium]|jgi:L-threonylcarbamoyladenylate synthase
MRSLLLKISFANVTVDDPAIRQAAAIIRHGGLVAFPTETVYGLGGNALDREAVLRIFEAKQRPAWDPIIVHACSLAMAKTLVRAWPEAAQKLSACFMPGPLTLLLPKHDIIPDACTAGREKVGIRIPAHPVALALIEAAGVPIAAPSANRFGAASPTTAAHVQRDLDGRIDAILDAGPAEIGVESTVIDITAQPPIIYRPGGISREQIEFVIGPVRLAARETHGGVPPESLESPGLGIRHYAPRARLVLVDDERAMAKAIEQFVARGEHVGLMLPDGWLPVSRKVDPIMQPGAGSPADADLSVTEVRQCVAFSWGKFDQLPMLAARLYAGLRWLDEHQATIILCPVPPATGIGLAIVDRLRKAAAQPTPDPSKRSTQ